MLMGLINRRKLKKQKEEEEKAKVAAEVEAALIESDVHSVSRTSSERLRQF